MNVSTMDLSNEFVTVTTISPCSSIIGEETAIISVQSDRAQEVADILVDAGIKGILNFTPRRLEVSDDITVQSVDLTSELQTLLFFMQDKKASNK